MECIYSDLSAAASIDEVVRLTSQYLRSWSREELERLPDSCRPGWVRGPNDIEQWADTLAVESAKAALFAEDERKLDRMTSHFLIASLRIRQLAPA